MLNQEEIDRVAQAVEDRMRDKYVLLERVDSIDRFTNAALLQKKNWVETVILHAAQYFGVSVKDMKNSTQAKEFVSRRDMVCKICRDLSDKKVPLFVIGSAFGKDHSTAVTAIKRAEKQIEGSMEASLQYSSLKMLIESKLSGSGF